MFIIVCNNVAFGTRAAYKNALPCNRRVTCFFATRFTSADRARHRLPRGGDRQLNHALHIVALTQVRMRGSSGRGYYDTKIAAGKTANEAMR